MPGLLHFETESPKSPPPPEQDALQQATMNGQGVEVVGFAETTFRSSGTSSVTELFEEVLGDLSGARYREANEEVGLPQLVGFMSATGGVPVMTRQYTPYGGGGYSKTCQPYRQEGEACGGMTAMWQCAPWLVCDYSSMFNPVCKLPVEPPTLPPTKFPPTGSSCCSHHPGKGCDDSIVEQCVCEVNQQPA